VIEIKAWESLMPIKGFIFDLDGTVYLGEAALPGAVEGISRLRKMGMKVLFVSNKPLEPREAYAKKLSKLGIPAQTEDVITSGFVMGYHLSKHFPNLNYYVIGEDNLHHELRGHGLKILAELTEQNPLEVIQPHVIDAVIVAFDRTLDYRKLNTAYQALVKGAKFFATNADKMCPMPGGGIPDAGGTIAALEHMTGRKLELLAGKPSSLITDVALERLGLRASEVVMVGDRLETDILMGQQAGMQTAVTLTGAAKREDVLELSNAPTYIIESLNELPESIGQQKEVTSH
jgi:arabinose operon protein AraL